DELGFPQFQKTDSPLFFIPVGAFKMSADVVFKMRAKGFFLNTASFPAVPMRKSGIRFMVNNFLKKEHIDEMLTTLCNVYSETIIENDTNYKKIAKTFNIPEFDLNIPSQLQHDLTKSPLSINIHRSIKELNAQEWNNTFFKNGTLTHSNLALIEDIYSKDSVLENQWDFYYLVIKDHEGKTVLQSPITVALTKDDMLHPGSVSQKIETVRAEKSPYYLTSKTVLTGTLITKGNHVYIDYTNPNWKCALSVLIDTLNTILDETGASKIMIRDFYGKQDLDFETAMLEKGFIKFQLLNNMEINKLDWNNRDEYLKSLSQKYRYNVRKEIIKYESHFVTTTQKITSEEELLKAYQLYEQVYDKSYDLNVFKLPLDFFRNICASDEYDVIRLYINNTDANGENILVGVMFSHVHEDIYNAMIVGLNYEYVYNYNCYKQILYKTLLRAKELDCNKLDLAFTAELEKKKLGAKPTEVFAYVQSTEHLKGSILAFT
ncbi:MAG: GNAT family N-acetyltransferase, partial [Aureispira sp.]